MKKVNELKEGDIIRVSIPETKDVFGLTVEPIKGDFKVELYEGELCARVYNFDLEGNIDVFSEMYLRLETTKIPYEIIK